MTTIFWGVYLGALVLICARLLSWVDRKAARGWENACTQWKDAAERWQASSESWRRLYYQQRDADLAKHIVSDAIERERA